MKRACKKQNRGNKVDYHRLRWAGRRGMLELDLILEPFLDNVYDTLQQSDKELYWELLASEDPDLYKWFIGKEQPISENLKKIVAIVLSHTGIKNKIHIGM